MEDEEEARRLHQRLVEDEYLRKEAELAALDALGRESGFSPRQSLARTPPQGFSGVSPQLHQEQATPMDVAVAAPSSPVTLAPSKKRLLASPEEVQEAVRRRTARERHPAPPVAGILTGGGPQAPPPPSCVEELSHQPTGPSKVELLASVREHLKVISATSGASTGPPNKYKLNSSERDRISTATQEILAIVAMLELQLADAEQAALVAKNAALTAKLEASRATSMGVGTQFEPQTQQRQPHPHQQPLSYAACLRVGGGNTLRKPDSGEAVLAIYPATVDGEQGSGDAEATKVTLKRAINPKEMGAQVTRVRKVGNGGVLISTTTKEAMERIKKSVPPSLKVVEPKKRLPLVVVMGVDDTIGDNEFLACLKGQNFNEDPDWPLERLDKEMRIAFKRRRNGGRSWFILECSAALREVLVQRERVYVEWDRLGVRDYIDVTCCSKCQSYGHAARFCRANVETCGRCGADGHRSDSCQTKEPQCATCKRAGKTGYEDHRTASAGCPARKVAEKRAINLRCY